MKTIEQSTSRTCTGAAFPQPAGGDPYVSQLLAERILHHVGPAQLISPGDLRDDAFVVSIGMVGAPTVTLEQLPMSMRLSEH